MGTEAGSRASRTFVDLAGTTEGQEPVRCGSPGVHCRGAGGMRGHRRGEVNRWRGKQAGGGAATGWGDGWFRGKRGGR